MYVYIYIRTYIHTYRQTYNTYMLRIPSVTCCCDADASHTHWPRRYGACPIGTAGTPPDCAQCETGYVPPRLPGRSP